MNQLNQVFAFNHDSKYPCLIRVLGTAEDPLFPATDACRALGINNPRQALVGIDEDDVITTDVIDSLGRTQKTNCLTESGLYRLIFISRKPKALAFQRWVTKEVLPSIRRTGSYSHGGTDKPELIKMYYSAKTGAVQLKILEAAGFGPAEGGRRHPSPPRARVMYEEQAFWPAVLALLESGGLPLNVFRTQTCATAPDTCDLLMDALPVVQALAAQPRFLNCRQQDLQRSAKGWPSWIPGKHKARLLGICTAVWAFRLVDPAGALAAIIKLVNAK